MYDHQTDHDRKQHFETENYRRTSFEANTPIKRERKKELSWRLVKCNISMTTGFETAAKIQLHSHRIELVTAEVFHEADRTY